MKKIIIPIIISLLIAGGLVAAVALKPVDTAPLTNETDTMTVQEQDSLASGRYEVYDENIRAAEGYNETILFFHAPWCPECRAFEQAIEASTIPDGVQILKVDYDSSSALKTKYGVTLQSTFVRVSSDGAVISKWVGYGEDKSVDAIIENT